MKVIKRANNFKDLSGNRYGRLVVIKLNRVEKKNPFCIQHHIVYDIDEPGMREKDDINIIRFIFKIKP